MPRPNVAPRPVCRYYNTSRGCFAGDKCHYLHGDPSEQKYAPYEENKTCRYFSQGYCKRGRQCWYKHVEPKANEHSFSSSSMSAVTLMPSNSSLTPRQSNEERSLEKEDIACGICFEERPTLYGLLNGCSHAFCLPCIRRWRDPDGKGIDLTESGMHKTCPMCRTKSRFVVPSSLFFSQGDPRKVAVIESYKLSMSGVPCRYFALSSPRNRFCPFGKDCFYQHLDEDGTPYVFAEGVDAMMSRRRRVYVADDVWDTDQLQIVLEALEGSVGLPSSGDNEEYEATHAVNSPLEDIMDGGDDTMDDNNICREVLSLHLGQMMRMMGHTYDTGMIAPSPIDLEALLVERTSSELDEESWAEDEPLVVYTGDLCGDADDEDDGEDESDLYWDDPLPNSPVASVAPVPYLDVKIDEGDEGDYDETSPEVHPESEPEESEVETEIEDVVLHLNISVTVLPCFAVVDECWGISLGIDENFRFMDQLW